MESALAFSIGVLEKGYLNYRRRLSIGVLKKQLLRSFVHSCQQNFQGGVLFKYTPGPSLDFSKKLFRAKKNFLSYSVENLWEPAYVKRNFTANIVSGIFQNFKNMQSKTEGCNLKACNLL